MNSWNGMGRLTADPQISNVGAKGTAKASFTIAVDYWTGKKETGFFDVELWGKKAENAQRFLHKGDLVGITGELHQSRWEKDGKKHSKVFIAATDFTLTGKREDSRDADIQRVFDGSEEVPF